MQPEVPATIQSHYELLDHKASECIGCHACESRCPFGVPIAGADGEDCEVIWVLSADKTSQVIPLREPGIGYIISRSISGKYEKREEKAYVVLACTDSTVVLEWLGSVFKDRLPRK